MIVGIIRRKPVLTHANIVCEGMLASVNSVNLELQTFRSRKQKFPRPFIPGNFRSSDFRSSTFRSRELSTTLLQCRDVISRSVIRPADGRASRWPNYGRCLPVASPVVFTTERATVATLMRRYIELEITSGEIEFGSCNSSSPLVIKDLR